MISWHQHFAWIVFTLSCAVVYAAEDPLELRTIEKNQGKGADLLFKNHSNVPYTVHLKVRGSNISAKCTRGCLVELAAGQQKVVDSVSPRSKERSWRYNTEHFYSIGKTAKDHNQDYAYLPPFAHGQKYPLEQGFDGSFSHKGAARYAVDFTMPEGSAVHAARGGDVIKVEQHYKGGGLNASMKDKANHILISEG